MGKKRYLGIGPLHERQCAAQVSLGGLQLEQHGVSVVIIIIRFKIEFQGDAREFKIEYLQADTRYGNW